MNEKIKAAAKAGRASFNISGRGAVSQSIGELPPKAQSKIAKIDRRAGDIQDRYTAHSAKHFDRWHKNEYDSLMEKDGPEPKPTPGGGNDDDLWKKAGKKVSQRIAQKKANIMDIRNKMIDRVGQKHGQDIKHEQKIGRSR